MAISTYAELQSALTNWLKRGGLTDRIPEFITLGESRIAREVRASQMETTTTLSVSSATVALPSDYLAMRGVRVQGSAIGWCIYLPPDKFMFEFESSSQSSVKSYTIIGSNLIFPKTPGADLDLWYYKKLAALSSAVNTLFTDNPDLYLYAAMSVAQPFMKNTEQMPVWEGLYQQAKESVNAQHKEGRYPSGMAVRPA